MAIDPNIALGVRGIELQNPLNALAQYSQIQGAQQANKLGQMQMAEYERARTEEEGLRNYLAGADLTATETRNALMAKFGKTGREFAKGLTELDKARTEESARKAKLAIDKTSMYRDAVATITSPADAIEFMKLQANDPDMAGTPITRMPLMKVLSSIPQDPVGFENWKKQTALGMTKFVEQNKPNWINAGGANVAVGGLTGTAIPGVANIQDVPLPANVEQQKIRIGLASRPVQNVTLPPQEKAEQADRGKLLVKQYEGISEAARIGARSLPALQSNATILDKGFDTGFGTEAKAAGAKVLGALGVKDAENYATDAQTFLGNASAAVLQRQLEQKGPQTEADAQRITQTGAQLGNTKQANKFFIDVAKEQIQRDIDQRNFYDKWWKANKTYDGAEDAWYSSEGSKSLFERPNLKKYTAPTKANSGASTVDNRAAGLDAIFGKKP